MYEYAYIFVINFFNIVIVYNALMHKIECGQSYGKDLHKRILNKFTLYFSEFYTNVYEYLKFGWILRFKSIQK
jgi:hypothetical protein